ncbi:hypothetical protein BCR33DRAFT_410489 [Rhizoclosmatium globosum]|uniref:Sphingomyelin synthase-like domain-containing protein n=1 Tax=Rhizoclosmatium globosum TaxID=329046 RepID=A0A1Y2BX14_9FUNG|nr:hypothetical protein BCR33DRAFT_410489 [Rhizoclosmatium globosum]|eukprot:ORY39312.1 hypothetical protein BCR33DRAFT_410489 [Rhizoclosmatium globosum]
MWNKLNTPQFKRTLTLLITLGLIAYAMVFVQMWSDDKTLQIAKGASIIPLNDTVYDNLIPNSFKTLPDTIADVPIAVSLVSVILFSLWTHWKRDPLRALRRSLFVLNLLYFGRMVSLSTTRVPPSNPEYCRPFPEGSQVFLTSLNTLTSNLRSCSDMMYSGHTSILSTLPYALHLMLNIFQYCLVFLFELSWRVFTSLQLLFLSQCACTILWTCGLQFCWV